MHLKDYPQQVHQIYDPVVLADCGETLF
jgi:hypothetical protein